MPVFPRFGDPPECPMCEGPCREPFERGEYVLGDKARKRAAEDRAIHGPEEDR